MKKIKMLTEIEDYDFDKLLIYYDNVIIKLNIFVTQTIELWAKKKL